jgi:hypothetical protein
VVKADGCDSSLNACCVSAAFGCQVKGLFVLALCLLWATASHPGQGDLLGLIMSYAVRLIQRPKHSVEAGTEFGLC